VNQFCRLHERQDAPTSRITTCMGTEANLSACKSESDVPIRDKAVENEATRIGHLRLRQVNRDQVTPVPARLDALLPENHLARQVWDAIERLDLSAFYAQTSVREDGPGQAATDPKILVALWLYATSQGVTQARELDRLCVEHLAYIWLCGGVTMNYHTLSDFRVQHGAALDQLMTDILGHLIHAGEVEFAEGAQDGMRVRASAGAASFHRQPTLEKSLEQARQLVAASEPARSAGPDADADGDGGRGAGPAARERAARERVERLEHALAEMPEAQAAKPKGEQEQARVSSTDPEARVMKMADGGYRPAYNWEFAVDSAHRVILGVDVVTTGSDKAQMPPMLEQVKTRCGRLPDDWLVDGGFVSLNAIELASLSGVQVLAPVPTPKDKTRDPFVPLATDSPVIAVWRERMGSDEAKQTYKLRAATVECVNAQTRTCNGVQQVTVRGQRKVLCLALWVAITHNLLIALKQLGHWGTAPVPSPALV
jgi:transposase